ncbi:transcriptional regulator [Desulfovibrio sulfodismutans]|uniref:Transcriptional regulator n=1 Tax=Desulfolutivibrio sulfodismutans TaxID=63561 RepID=A0A7K3NMG1_9BACT|nr:ATP-binding protein [Desulfolutivibrio sulfodismutans]NDY57381.1 transcriptional regulator [Desulfolutivibrio sulfodismutans]QLA12919.1 transcriptional regulator [Desulfolutivibrio sulfodismutans DSM 3696]
MVSELLASLLAAAEGATVEFKEAKRGLERKDLFRYCIALANERGGKLVLGVADAMPRQVVGTTAFGDLDDARNAIYQATRLNVEIVEDLSTGSRVLIFLVPSRPIGTPLESDGQYLMRRGSSLVPMTPDRLQAIFAESVPDFSAEICSEVTLADLSPQAIETFRQLWARQSNRPHLLDLPDQQLLEDAELLVDSGVTRAALILLGTAKSLSRHVADAEIIFEYRHAEGDIDPAVRESFREGLFLYVNRLWALVNLRNEVHPYQMGLVRRDIPSFREEVIREALLNGVCHRDYRYRESIFVRQFPGLIEVESPGGLLPGVTIENMLFKRAWRNRLIAEALEKADLIERSGQGVDRMWRLAILDGKMPPDYSRTDEHHVYVRLPGTIHDPALLRFLEEVGAERYRTFSAMDFAVLHFVSQEQEIPKDFRGRANGLVDQGILERVGRKFIFARRYYEMRGEAGVHTRKRGLDRETNLFLVRNHLRSCGGKGCVLAELQPVLPHVKPRMLSSYLEELKRRGQARVIGKTKGARWYHLVGNDG